VSSVPADAHRPPRRGQVQQFGQDFPDEAVLAVQIIIARRNQQGRPIGEITARITYFNIKLYYLAKKKLFRWE
jgi:hypothetical protein